MKRFLSLLLVMMTVFGTLSMVTGVVAQAADYKTEVWQPVEITLTSSVEYKKPYISTEIDAVFKHSDGTTIALPGFWKEGDTWAVRFSPTKVGNWTYTITCKDASNTGLNGSGTIEAVAATSKLELHQRGFVKVVPNERVYRYDDGTPFFWLGDTNWQAPMNMTTKYCNFPGCTCGNQLKHLVDDRVAKGFNVFQTYFVPGSGNGEKSVWSDGKYEKPNTEIFNTHVDEMFKYIYEKGMVIAMGLGCHNSTMSNPGWDAEVYLRFARYIVARYACYSIVWISGQEITNSEPAGEKGLTVFEAYMQMSERIEELDGYKHPNSAHMYPANATDEKQITLDRTNWHDSWTIQGGHGGKEKAKSMYQSYYLMNVGGKFKPFIESELNYEDINCGGFTGYDANRRGAWKAVLSGSAGFTYGVTGIWAHCYSTSKYTGWFDGRGGSYSYEPWYMGLGKPGSFEMTYMKNFFLNLPDWSSLVPRYFATVYGDFLRRETASMLSATDSSTVVVYFSNGNTKETGTIKMLQKDATYKAYWYNTLTGKYIKVSDSITAPDGNYTMPERPTMMDWAFVMTTGEIKNVNEEAMFTDLNPNYDQVAVTGTLTSPVNVTAIGGISYSKGKNKGNQIMSDNTSYIHDNNPETVWEPFADRTSQTILYDLGEAKKLTHITITPNEGTIIPRFRVEGSNDGANWTIITNTATREADNPGSASEPLSGGYRYVKILLLNADTLQIKKEEVKDQPYKCYWNEETQNAYSVTEITDINVYTDGKAEVLGDGTG
ncbi:MAG: DUF4038 domain-containing protein, partial [Clostridia bacterium]|nr:DUF4038 domain-containing protein [Clostridia bacterium]